MIVKKTLRQLNDLFSRTEEVGLAYLFGSQTTEAGPLSDFDFAVYLDCKDRQKINEIRLALLARIIQVLRTERVDLVMLNLTQNPELKYRIIKDGVLLFEKEPFRVLVEPRILTEYFDFNLLLQRHHLTSPRSS